MPFVLACLVAPAWFASQAAVDLKSYKLPLGVSVLLPSQPVDRTEAKSDVTVFVSVKPGISIVIGSQPIKKTADAQSPAQVLAATVMGSLSADPGKMLTYKPVQLN